MTLEEKLEKILDNNPSKGGASWKKVRDWPWAGKPNPKNDREQLDQDIFEMLHAVIEGSIAEALTSSYPYVRGYVQWRLNEVS